MECFTDGCGEAGQAQGFLNGSSLHLRSNLIATSPYLACKEVTTQQCGGVFMPNVNILRNDTVVD